MGASVTTARDSTRLGKYRVIAALGHGGMADVHLAELRGPAGVDRLVVIKRIRAELADEHEARGMFLDEARLAARLTHPNIVETYEVGQEGEHSFIAMELLDGQPLSRMRARMGGDGGLSLAMQIHVLAQVLAGLHHAHELADLDGSPLGVVHRDVTPDNVLVTYEGAVKIIDFGVAKARCSIVETRAGMLKGKLTYMAPEQVMGGDVDRRADVFAVGIMLWEAVTHRRPWAGLDDLSIVQCLRSGHFPSAREANPDVPAEIEEILATALATDREERYATAAELQADLEACLDHGGAPVRAHDLGRLVQRYFPAERARVRGLVEQQARAGREEARQESGPPVAIADPITVPEARAARPPPVAPPDVARGSLSPVHVSAAPARLLGRRRVIAGLGVIAAASFVVGAVCALPGRHAAGASLAPLPSAVASEIRIDIDAIPSTATIFLDDVSVGLGAYRTAVPRDGADHEVRVEAPGFERGVQRVTFDRDRRVSIALAVVPVRAAEAGGPRAPSGPLVRPGVRRRNMDPRNPYPSE